MTTEEILQILNEKFGTIQDQSWFVSLQKTAHSKNITTAEWNSLLFHAARTVNDCDALKTAIKDFIDVYETNASDVERTLELHAKGLASIDASKVSKVDSDNVVYATDSEGAQTSVTYSESSTPGTLAVRDVYGNIQVSNPTDSQHAAPKKYVDDRTDLRLSIVYDQEKHSFYVRLDNEIATVSNSNPIDLPLEATVVNGSFDEDSKNLILELQNGNKIPIPLDDIITGLATETYVQENYVQSVKNTGNASVLYGERGNGAGPTQFKINSGAAEYAVPYRDASGQVAAPNQVSLPPSQDQFISRRYFEANDKSYYDRIITTEAEFLSIGNYSGNVLVKCVTLSSTPVNLTLKEDTHLTFIDFNMPSDGKLSIDGTSGTIRGFHVSSQYATVTLKNFSNVKQVSCGAISRLCLVECQHISDSKFYEATSCTYIDNCDLSLLNAVYITDCKYVCGIRASSTIGVGFSNCSFISNVDCNGTYKNCTYVDAESCKGFVQDEGVGKVQVITNDGTFQTADIPDTGDFVQNATFNDVVTQVGTIVDDHESRITALEEGGGSGGGKLYRHSISIEYYNPENWNAASGTCYLPPLYSTSDTPINSRDSLLAMVEQLGTASYHDFMCEYNSIVVFNDGINQHMVYACRISKANWFTLQLFYFDFSASSLYNAPISETKVTQTEFIITVSDTVVEV